MLCIPRFSGLQTVSDRSSPTPPNACGEGSFGTTYRDGDTMIKVSHDGDRLGELGIVADLVREVAFGVQVRGAPNLVQITSICVTSGETQLRSEYAGQPITPKIVADLAPDVLRDYVRDVLRALAELNERGIAHRDIKPSNVVVKDGVATVIDLGISKGQIFQGMCAEGHTKPVQTRWYRAPEVADDSHGYGPAMDSWSVGMMFLELTVGHSPMRHTHESNYSQLLNMWRPFWHLKWASKGLARTPSPMPLGKRYSKINAWGEAFVDLLEKLLDVNPDTRPTPAEALNHPYFAGTTPCVYKSPATLGALRERCRRIPLHAKVDTTQQMAIEIAMQWMHDIAMHNNKGPCLAEAASILLLDVNARSTVLPKEMPTVAAACFWLSFKLRNTDHPDAKNMAELVNPPIEPKELVDAELRVMTLLRGDVAREGVCDVVAAVAVAYGTSLVNPSNLAVVTACHRDTTVVSWFTRDPVHRARTLLCTGFAGISGPHADHFRHAHKQFGQ
jgi:hypothetical protein